MSDISYLKNSFEGDHVMRRKTSITLSENGHVSCTHIWTWGKGTETIPYIHGFFVLFFNIGKKTAIEMQHPAIYKY